MGKIGKLIHRLFKRSETATPAAAPEPEAGAACPPGDPVQCVDGKLYRMRLRAGRWETFGPPIGDCAEEE